jgi:hypothetical protein
MRGPIDLRVGHSDASYWCEDSAVGRNLDLRNYSWREEPAVGHNLDLREWQDDTYDWFAEWNGWSDDDEQASDEHVAMPDDHALVVCDEQTNQQVEMEMGDDEEDAIEADEHALAVSNEPAAELELERCANEPCPYMVHNPGLPGHWGFCCGACSVRFGAGHRNWSWHCHGQRCQRQRADGADDTNSNGVVTTVEMELEEEEAPVMAKVELDQQAEMEEEVEAPMVMRYGFGWSTVAAYLSLMEQSRPATANSTSEAVAHAAHDEWWVWREKRRGNPEFERFHVKTNVGGTVNRQPTIYTPYHTEEAAEETM